MIFDIYSTTEPRNISHSYGSQGAVNTCRPDHEREEQRNKEICWRQAASHTFLIHIAQCPIYFFPSLFIFFLPSRMLCILFQSLHG